MDLKKYSQTLSKMNFIFAISLILFIDIPVVTGQGNGTKTCKKIDACSCRMSDGSGVVNIRTLGRRDGQPRFKDIGGSQDQFLYSYNPCYPFSEGNGCPQVAVCQELEGQEFPIGVQSQADWDIDQVSKKDVTITYNTGGGVAESTIVTCKCDRSVTDKPAFAAIGSATGQAPYFLTLTHRCCCANECGDSEGGLSAGSVLIIIFVSLLLVYLIGGLVYQKFAKKETGANVIPNSEFWQSLPFLVRDGVVFVFSCGKTDNLYKSMS